MKQVRFKVNQEKREDKNLSSLYYFCNASRYFYEFDSLSLSKIDYSSITKLFFDSYKMLLK